MMSATLEGVRADTVEKYLVWDLFIEKEHRARKLSSFLLVKALILHVLETKVAATLVTPPAMLLANASANKLYRSFGYRSVCKGSPPNSSMALSKSRPQ